MHGDGTSLWTLTHSDDFAKGFVPLLGNTRTIGEAFHITSDDVLTWNQIDDLGERGRCRGEDRPRAVGHHCGRRSGLGYRAAWR